VNPTLAAYADAAGQEVIEHLRQLARPLAGSRVVHVNSTAVGGGVAEILNRLIPLKRELGIQATWELIEGNPEFFAVTKRFHNTLQGDPAQVSSAALATYQEVNRRNAERLEKTLSEADFAIIHDPQPAALIRSFPARKGKWAWRCHIDVSRPYRPVWKFLREFVQMYDASIFSMAAFAQRLDHPQYLIPPSIDPLSEKNLPLEPAEVDSVAQRTGLDPNRAVVLQVSRFDRFKDPVGVIQAYRLARPHLPLQLVLAGGTADDDPEGGAMLEEVRREAGDDPDVHVLALPPDAHRTINALQRRADLVLQKSIREGFGLTVTEALWKEKPVIGGATGGITLQVINNHTGFLVNTPEGAAFRMRYLLNRPELRAAMGAKGKRFVQENYLLTRHLREYLTVMLALMHGARERIELK